jgi:hypothetical protein
VDTPTNDNKVATNQVKQSAKRIHQRPHQFWKQTMSKPFFLNAMVLVVGLVTGLLLSEIALRCLGYRAWQYRSDKADTVIHQPDSDLGWISKPGTYILPPYDSTGRPIKYTFYADGSRATSLSPNTAYNNTPEIVIVGCSFSQGLAVSDNETYAWDLQTQFPNKKVLNYGTSGYGSYQSLLRLERTLPNLPNPKLVVYGFIENHEIRNVATAEWLESVSKVSTSSYDVYVPFVTLAENDALVRHKSKQYVKLPLREYSAVVVLLERVIMKLSNSEPRKAQQKVTDGLILEMKKVSESYGAKFMMVVLSAGAETLTHYTKYANQNNIAYANCSFSQTEDMTVKGEGIHPNGRMHALWAKCIGEAIAIQGG